MKNQGDLFTKEEVKFLLKTMSPEYGQGALAFGKNGKIYKVYSQKYVLSEIIKKTGKLDILDSPKSQYVQSLRLKPKQRDALQESLKKKHPQQKRDFQKIDKSIDDYIDHIKFWYNKFFVEGERSFVDKTTYIILQSLKKSKKSLEKENILEELSKQKYNNFKHLFEDEKEVIEEDVQEEDVQEEDVPNE